MSSENVSPEIAKFAVDVRRALAHLTTDQIAELTGDLEANVMASVADGSRIPEVDAYVAELLSAAGLEAPSPAVKVKKKTYAEIVTTVRRITVGLAPMWWLIRAIAVTILIGAFTSLNPAWGGDTLMIRVADNVVLGWIVLALAIAVSVWFGRIEMRFPLFLRLVPGIVIVALAIAGARDEMKWATGRWAARDVCYEFGFDPMGRQAFPAEPFPDLVGLSLYDADRVLTEWSAGLAVSNVLEGAEIVMSPHASVMSIEQPYIDISGICPYIVVPLHVGETAPSPLTTSTLPAETTTTTSPMEGATTTSLLGAEPTVPPVPTTPPGYVVPAPTTAPGAVSPTPVTVAPSPIPMSSTTAKPQTVTPTTVARVG